MQSKSHCNLGQVVWLSSTATSKVHITVPIVFFESLKNTVGLHKPTHISAKPVPRTLNENKLNV